jgi:osmotically-inducible protein OsmY
MSHDDWRYPDRHTRDARSQRGEQGHEERDFAERYEEWRGGYGDTAAGEPPRYVGGAPGYGPRGMGYGPAGGSQGGSWGVYGVPRDLAHEYASDARSGPPGRFDQPHGRMPFGWSGTLGSQDEHSSRAESIRPAERGAGGSQSGSYRHGGAGADPHTWRDSVQQGRDLRDQHPGANRGVASMESGHQHTSGDPRAERQSSWSSQQPSAPRRAPRNYQRSDERIHDDIYGRLMSAQRIEANDVIVEVKDGEVTLHGTVAHRAMKYWIEDVVADTYGVKDVENKLRVALVAAWPGQGSSI